MAATPTVQIIGLKGVRKDLLKLDRENAPAAMVAAGLAVANPLVAKIQQALPVQTGRLRGTVRAGKVRTGATVRVGTKAVPYAGWVEFGGTRRNPHISTREFVKDGRYIFPTARGEASDAVQRYAAEMQRIIDSYSWSQAKD